MYRDRQLRNSLLLYCICKLLSCKVLDKALACARKFSLHLRHAGRDGSCPSYIRDSNLLSFAFRAVNFYCFTHCSVSIKIDW